MLPPVIVDIQLVSLDSGRRVKLESKALCKILHLAVFHGWRHERQALQLPSAAWDTEVVVPYIEPYLSGSVSETDAKDLAEGLRRMLAWESAGLSQQLLFAALAVLSVAEKGAFGLIPETNTTDPGQPHDGKGHGPGPGVAATG